jgi:hypothetical protein
MKGKGRVQHRQDRTGVTNTFERHGPRHGEEGRISRLVSHLALDGEPMHMFAFTFFFFFFFETEAT